MSHCTYIQCTLVPARSAVHVLRPDRFQPLAVRAAAWPCSPPCAPVPVCASADAWSTVDFLVRRPCAPGLLARFPCACGRARARVCVGAVRLPSSRLPCILFAYNVHSPPLCQACPPRFHPAANFFEIVFKPSISIPLSSVWADDSA